MNLALTGSAIDGTAYTDVVGWAHRSPGWFDDAVLVWANYGLAFFAVLMIIGWWRSRREGATAAMTALTVPVAVVVTFAVNTGIKSLVQENRPCHTLRVSTLEACPAPGDWSFPSNHAAIAAATAVALFFVSRRLGIVAAVAAVVMAASRVWIGVHYPHDVVVGAVIGGLVAFVSMALLRRWLGGLAQRLSATRLRPLLVS